MCVVISASFISKSSVSLPGSTDQEMHPPTNSPTNWAINLDPSAPAPPPLLQAAGVLPWPLLSP